MGSYGPAAHCLWKWPIVSFSLGVEKSYRLMSKVVKSIFSSSPA